MLQDKIITYFQRNPTLKVLFFFDPQGEFKDDVEALDLPDVHIRTLRNNWFNLKIKLNALKEDEKVFLHLMMPSPQTQEEYLNFPLLGLLKANKELLLGDVGTLMEDFGLLPYQTGLLKKYKSELQYTQTQLVLRPYLNAGNFIESNVQQGLICTFLDCTKMEDWDLIIVRMLSYAVPGKEKELRRFFKKINDNQLLDTLNAQLRKYFDVVLPVGEPDELTSLITRLKYNSITQNLPTNEADPYKALKIKNSDCIVSLNRIRELGMNHSTLSKNFTEAIEIHGESIQELKIIELYGHSTDFMYMTDKLKWVVIGILLDKIATHPTECETQLEKLSFHTQDDSPLKDTLAFLRYATGVISKIAANQSLRWDKPDDYIEKYTGIYYAIDLYYRKSILNYRILELNTLPVEDKLELLKGELENKYAKFIYTLNREWLQCLSSVNFDYKQLNTPKQYDFYKNQIAPRKQKVAVIISDALRYEIAHELVNELHKDDKNVSQLSCQLASIPSETSFGMSNLLPGNTYTYDGEIKIDGEKTNTIDVREKILRKQNDNYRAVSYDTILNGTKQTNRELFKSELVYIYHDIVDKEGHKGTERNVFTATQTAISELAKIVKQIQGGFAVNRVIITSDHGFIYNDSDIDEVDKNEMVACNAIESGARHYITFEDPYITTGYKVPLYKTTKYQEPYTVIIPDSVNRFKKAGSRYKFTHGGGSLQELIVPIIESTRKEERIQRKVNPILLGSNLSVVSNTLKIQIIQQNPLSANEKERTIEIALYSSAECVSNKMQLVLNSSGEIPSERIFSITLTLIMKTADAVLKLKIFDKEDSLNPLIEENVKNNTLIERDF